MKQGLLWEHVVPTELTPSVLGGCPVPQPCPLYSCWSDAGATLGGQQSVGSLRWASALLSRAEMLWEGRWGEPCPQMSLPLGALRGQRLSEQRPECTVAFAAGEMHQFSDRALFSPSKDLKAVEGLVFSFRFIPHSPPFSVSLCLSLCWRERKKEGGREPSGPVNEAAKKPLLQRLSLICLRSLGDVPVNFIFRRLS